MADPVVQPTPDDVLTRAVSLAYENASDEWPAPTHGDIQAAVERAAPIIDRAARIAELKRWASDLDEDVKALDETARLPGTDIEGQERCEQQAVAVENIAECIRERIAELEASDVHPTDA